LVKRLLAVAFRLGQFQEEIWNRLCYRAGTETLDKLVEEYRHQGTGPLLPLFDNAGLNQERRYRLELEQRLLQELKLPAKYPLQD